jgi:threonine/homoserine/homoserine lactone efflux protein
MEDPVLFALAVLAILGTPGPTNTLLAISGAGRGLRQSLPLLPAEACGYLISILVLGLALGPVVAASPAISTALRLAVGAYLVVLAVKLWRRSILVPGEVVEIRPRQVFITTLLNPKAIIFALGVIPFGAQHAWAYMLGFLGLLTVVGFGWIMAGAGAGSLTRGHAQTRFVPRLGAAAIGMFAALIVLSPFVL